MLAIAAMLAIGSFASTSFAGEKEEEVFAKCALNPTSYWGYVFCVGAGVTGNEVQTCISQPEKCYGPNNELRKLFCSIGIGGMPKTH
jgi:hypothetical protein